MTKSMMLDRRLLLASMGAMALPGAAFAKPKDYPAVQAFLDAYIGTQKLACCVVGIKHDAAPVEYLSAGTLALDTPALADPDSIFRIYSMTKPITGIAFMTLVEKGVLRLDQPITDILPEFAQQRVMIDGKLENTRPAASPILMRHLVTHTSGLSYSINGQATLAQAYASYGLGAGGRATAAGLMRPTDKFPPARDLETFGRRLATLPLDFDPGSRWQYSVGLDLMGLVIQRAAGVPFEDYLQRTIFQPLKMNDTDFVVPRAKQNRLTSVYNGRNTPITVNDDRNASPFSMDRDLPSGGGGGVSTTRDYMRFAMMMMNDGALDGVRILRPESMRIARSGMMDTGVSATGFGGEGNVFGAGMQVLAKASALGEGAGTFGWDGAAGTTMWVDPVNRVAVAGMVQIQGGSSIHNSLREAIYKDLANKPASSRLRRRAAAL